MDWPRQPLLVYTQMFRHQDKWMSPVMAAFWKPDGDVVAGAGEGSRGEDCLAGCSL